MPRLHRSHLRISSLFICVLLTLSLVSGGIAAKLPQYLSLTILHTNDVHGHLFPIDDYDQKFQDGSTAHLNDVGGAARQATLIRRIKKISKSPVLVMSAGDVFTRGPVADLHGVPDMDVMNAVPYDVMVLGNNEFEGGEGMDGQKVLFDFMKQAHFPVLSANVFYKTTGKPIAPPYKIFTIKGVRIGVFGLTAPRVARYSTAVGLDVRDPIDVAKATVAELKNKADFIIALTHIGYDYSIFPCDLVLAREVPGIDVIIGGDSHTWLRHPTLVTRKGDKKTASYVGGTIVDQAGEWGVAVSEIDLRLRLNQGHQYHVAGYASKLIDVDSNDKPAADIDELVDNYMKPLHKELAELDREIPHAEMAVWLARCFKDAAGTQLGIAFPDTIENGLTKGTVDELALRRCLPFDEKVLVVTVTGKQIKDLIAVSHAEVYGLDFTEGEPRIGDQKLDDKQSYVAAVDQYWNMGATAIAKAPSAATEISVRDAMVKELKRAQ